MHMPASAPNLDERYPLGRFQPPAGEITAEDRRYAIMTLAELPEQMREAVRKLDADQLNTPYRKNGWTVRQVVHHVADSHMTAFQRVRKALTEDWPVVQGYDEAAFALLPDVVAPVDWSLNILENLHARWVLLLGMLHDEQWHRGFTHAERGRMSVEYATLMYAWHSRHHTAHIVHLRKRQHW